MKLKEFLSKTNLAYGLVFILVLLVIFKPKDNSSEERVVYVPKSEVKFIIQQYLSDEEVIATFETDEAFNENNFSESYLKNICGWWSTEVKPETTRGALSVGLRGNMDQKSWKVSDAVATATEKALRQNNLCGLVREEATSDE